MCGYCSEDKSFEVALAQATGETILPNQGQTSVAHSLQESNQLKLTISQNMGELKKRFNPDQPYTYVPTIEVIFCRAIGTLISDGFDSAEYQSLISDEFIRLVLNCGVIRPPLIDERLAGAESCLRKLFPSDFFTHKSQAEEIFTSPSILEDCENLLNAYVDWWHLGTSRDNAHIRDEIDLFQNTFPRIFFAQTYLAKHNPAHSSLRRLVNTNPGAPLSEALELWLQRKASLAVYRTAGLAAFLPYDWMIDKNLTRPLLIYYVMIHNKLTYAEKQTLWKLVANRRRRQNDKIPPWGLRLYETVESEIAELLQT